MSGANEGDARAIVAVFDALYETVCARDATAAFRLWSSDDDVAMYGSEGERAVGPPAVHDLLTAVATGARTISFVWRDHHVHVEQDSAWLTAHGTVDVDGQSSVYRTTAAFVRRDGRWLWHTHSGSESR